MGASNFARPQNASKYFVVLTNQEEKYMKCNECEHYHFEWEYDLETLTECDECGCTELTEETEYKAPDEWDVDNLKENLSSEIVEKLNGTDRETSFNDRNYERTSIAEIDLSKQYGDIEVELEFKIIIQSSYYEGATLDYLISVNNGSEFVEVDEYASVEDIINDLFEVGYEHYYSEMNKGLRKIHARNATKWVEQQIEITSKQIEEIFEQYSEHKLNCLCVASNGEAFYTEAK